MIIVSENQFSGEDLFLYNCLQIEVDDSRSVLYTRSEKGVVSVFDLGRGGDETVLVCCITQAQIVQEVARVAQNVDKSNFAPIVSISHIPTSESVSLTLLAVSANGVRYYFSTCARPTNNPMERPGTYCIKIGLPGKLILID